MHTNKLLYFSLDKEARKLFHQYAEKSRAVYEHSFQLVDKNSELCEYGHASDLMVILEHIDQHEDLGHFFVIIDYLSLCSNENKSSKEFDSPQKASDIIRRAILKYPDILFLFDECGAANYDFLDFLFNCSGIPKDEKHPAPNCIRKELHQFNVSKDSDPFFFIRRSRDNLFDGSNLRYFVKQFLYNEFRFAIRNFRFEQRSRAEHLAFCVEKEASQNKFNSYALYANGFRVTQILSAKELKYLNEKLNSENNNEGPEAAESENSKTVNDNDIKEFTKPDIIVRDFDLQFNDIESSNIIYKSKSNTDNSENNTISFKINEIDKIRGAKFFDNEYYKSNDEKEDNKEDKNKEPVDASCLNKWRTIEKENPYWSSFQNVPFYYVMAKEDAIDIETENKPSSEGSLFIGLQDSVIKQNLHGIIKPVSGLYTLFRQFKPVASRAKSIGEQEKEESYHITTKRRNHDHSVPLDVYDLAKSMVQRARKCYNNENYVRSAVIASEAIEVMNGFHLSLTIEAYSIKAKAENAIAMDILGGSEKELCEDACVRIEMIKKDVARLLGSNNAQSINVLSQIFSDCRNYCKEKEHFESEDVFLASMAEINEGITLNTNNSLKAFIKTLINRHREHFKGIIHCIIEEIKSYETDSKTDGTGIGKEGAGEGEREQE